MRPTPWLVACSIALVPLVGACGGDDDDDGSVAISIVPSGSIDVGLQEAVELPSEFPADVPLPADVLVEGAELLEGETSDLFEVTGWYDGDPVRAARDYLDALDDLGYEVTSRTEAPDSLFFTADDGEWFVSVGFFLDPVRQVGTSVGVTVGPAGSGAG